MDGTQLEALLVPEGQTTEPAATPAPAESTVPGQVAEPPASAEQVDGQGDPATAPAEEMIAKAQYDELRKAFTQKSMEASQLKKQVGQPQEQVQQAPAYIPQTGNPLANLVQQLVRDSVADFVAPLQQQQQDLRIQSKVDQLAINAEFEDVAPVFLEILEDSPELIDTDAGIMLAYKAAKSDYLERAGMARAQAVYAASQQTTAQKIAATDTTPIVKSNSTVTPADAEADAILQSMLSLGKSSSIFR